MDNIEFQKEKENLKNIIEEYEEVMEYYNQRIDAIPRIYMNNPTMIKNSIEMYSEKLRLMEKSVDKPYFARLDFARDGETKTEQLYIGKVGVMDEDNNNITIDWRAPVSSMYYDSNIGRASYKAPEGICTGELLLKRQYDIENRELKSYQDVDTVSNDELLKPYLGASADNRLKNIVSTIQQEQNAIIREPLNENIIIQGVAGSGKTTVALHRIAYLVYNYRDSIKPNQYLVIGPNKFFVNYISGVLPDLDVENVKQLTYEELCAEFLNENIKLIDEDKKLIQSIVNENLLKNDIKLSEINKKSEEETIDILVKKITTEYESKIKDIPEEVTDEFEKAITLQVVDNYWMEHINTMSHLREGIHLRGYAQEDPLRAYTMEGYDMFDEMLQKIDKDVTTFLLRAEIRQNVERKEVVKKKITNDGGKEPAKKTPKKAIKSAIQTV